MEANAFAGRSSEPTDAALAAVLGDTRSIWQSLLSDLKRDLDLTGDWHTGSVKMGWSFRLQWKKRNIVYLGPRQGWFLASFVLGEKAVAAAKKSELSAEVRKLIATAKRYPEGTALQIEVRKPEDLAAVKLLARIKSEN